MALDATELASHALELAMAGPMAVMAMAPVRDHLRVPLSVAVRWAAATVVGIVCCGSTLGCALGIPSWALLVPVALACFICYGRLVDLEVGKRLFCYANAAMPCTFATMWAIVSLSGIEVENTASALLPQTGATALAGAVVLGAVFWRTLTVKLPTLLSYHDIDSAWRWLCTIPAGLSALIVWMVPWDLSLLHRGRSLPIMLAMTALIPIFTWLIYHVTWWMARSITDAGHLRQENTLLRAEEKRYEELVRYMDQTRALRHDFRHHLLALEGLARDGKDQELLDYLDELTDVERRGQAMRLTANAAVDALASHYDARARKEGTQISWQLELPTRLPVAESDLCAILGNLVENALVAVAKLPAEQRRVTVRAREVTPTTLGLSVTNPYEGTVRLGSNGLPKARRAGHGIGLASVVTCAQAYGGGVDVRTEGGTFYVGVILCHEPAGSDAPER